jgi:hypothetical protein
MAITRMRIFETHRKEKALPAGTGLESGDRYDPNRLPDERSDFGLYSHQSRPWLNTPAAWLTRLETPLALVGAGFD